MFRIPARELSPKGKQILAAQIKTARYMGHTWDSIKLQCPVSITTIRRWNQEAMEIEQQESRQQHQRRPKLLNEAEQFILINQAKAQRANGKIVDINWTRETIDQITLGRVSFASDAYIVHFWNDHGWRSRRAYRRTPKEMRPSLQIEVILFIRNVEIYIQDHNIPNSQVFIMDETGIWNGAVTLRTYVDPETQDASVLSECVKQRDTGVVAISAEGEIYAEFIKHKAEKTRKENGKKIIVSPGIYGMNVEKMKIFAINFGTKYGNREKETVLILDNLRSHLNTEVEQIFKIYRVKLFFFPVNGAKYGSICDNSFFSSLKSRLTKEDTTTCEKKEKAFLKICSQYPKETILKYWHHCGWHFMD